HSGAPVAAAARSGAISGWLYDLYDECYEALEYYIDIFFDPVVAEMASALDGFFDVVGEVLGFVVDLGVSVVAPVSGDDVPGSGFILTLDSPGNLSREATDIPTRIGITSQVSSNTGVMWKGLAGASWSDYHDTQVAIGAIFLAGGAAASLYAD